MSADAPVKSIAEGEAERLAKYCADPFAAIIEDLERSIGYQRTALSESEAKLAAFKAAVERTR